MTTWIRFIQEFDAVVEIDRVELAFNSRMTEVHQGSDLDGIVDGMTAHIKMQMENPSLGNSRFRFDEDQSYQQSTDSRLKILKCIGIITVFLISYKSIIFNGCASIIH